jgi:NADH:ubiquinone oxidoreductase subunit
MFGKVSQAVGVLIANKHEVRERVWVASRHLFAVQASGLPPSCREDIKWIHHMLTRYPAEPPYRSRLQATFDRTRNATASKIAARVWTLYHLMDTELRKRGQ